MCDSSRVNVLCDSIIGNSTPLLRAADRNGDHHSSADSLDMEEPVPTPKPHTALLDHQSSVDHSAATGNSRPAGRSGDKSGGVVMMPDGSMVSIQRGAAGAASQTRSDLSSVERPLLQPAMTSAAGGVTPPGVPYDSAQEAPSPIPPPQPVSFQQFPPSQYRPYQQPIPYPQPISGQFSSPYTVYQQPVPQPVLQVSYML